MQTFGEVSPFKSSQGYEQWKQGLVQTYLDSMAIQQG